MWFESYDSEIVLCYIIINNNKEIIMNSNEIIVYYCMFVYNFVLKIFSMGNVFFEWILLWMFLKK